MTVDLVVNGQARSVQSDPATPLLWVLRDELGLTGTKYGCGAAQCGACTVHVDGRAKRSCVLPVSAAAGTRVLTIEGLSAQAGAAAGAAAEAGLATIASAVTQAWIAEDVPQCGWCQTGQIMSAAVLLQGQPAPSDDDIDAAMVGNICRCATYVRIRRAIHRAAGALQKGTR